MSAAAQVYRVSGRSECWEFEILSGEDSIAALAERGAPLFDGLPATSGPRFFLASLLRSSWIPRIVVAIRDKRIEGVLYAKERKIGKLGTRLLFGDSTLSTLIVAERGRADAVLAQAIRFLLTAGKAHGLRFRVPRDSHEQATLQRVATDLKAELLCREDPYHQAFDLPTDYESFLDSLSFKGRRNMRYYRRRFEAAGHVYVDRIDATTFEQVSWRLLDRNVVGGDREGVVRALSMFAEADQPLRAGLRRADGEWVALIGGWRQSGVPIVFFQMNNDRDYAAESLCVVLRSYFFESRIAKGDRRLMFWAGVGGPLAQVANPLPATAAYLDARTPAWRAVRGLCKRLAPHLPENRKPLLDWIVPMIERRTAPVSDAEPMI